MILILKDREKNLLKDVKDNEAVIRVPMKVTFDDDGKLIAASGIDVEQFCKDYNSKQ